MLTNLLTGYPFDIPGSSSNVLAYAALSYHLPLLIAFSLQQQTKFVWGGFMLLPLQDMLVDKHGILEVSASAEWTLTCIPAQDATHAATVAITRRHSG